MTNRRPDVEDEESLIKHYIGEAVRVESGERLPLKVAEPPTAFWWRERRYRVIELVRQWTTSPTRRSTDRDGRAPYSVRSGARSSWGVGRTYFRLRTDEGTFDLYYDRRPEKSRLGGWHLWRRVD